MKTCPSCYSDKVKQTSPILTRILIPVYIFLFALFFTGDIEYEALYALILLAFPYVYECNNCNHTFFRILSVWKKTSLLGNKNLFFRYLVAMLPFILTITLLITFFPNTGLGRIVYLPVVFFMNSMVILLCLVLTKGMERTNYFIAWGVICLLTLLLTIIFYPQV